MLSTDRLQSQIDPSTGDLTVPRQFVSGIAGVAQAARVAIQLIAGEWFLNLDLGVPYLERVGVDATKAILGQKFDQQKALRAFRTVLLALPGVVGIATLQVTFTGTTRAMTVTWSVQTAFGDTPVDTLALGK